MMNKGGRITLTFNKEIYSELLSRYQPKIIKNEEENDYFLAIVEELMSRKQLTPEEDSFLELLVALIENFEDKHYQLNASTPRSVLLHLMEARSLQPADLVEIFGSIEAITEVTNGKQEINKEQAKALGKFFHVEPSLLLSN